MIFSRWKNSTWIFILLTIAVFFSNKFQQWFSSLPTWENLSVVVSLIGRLTFLQHQVSHLHSQ